MRTGSVFLEARFPTVIDRTQKSDEMAMAKRQGLRHRSGCSKTKAVLLRADHFS